MKTITINTADLSGAALDWAVAVAIGKNPVLWNVCCGNTVGNPAECCLEPFVTVEVDMKRWEPSTDWSQGGPLMEKNAIVLWHAGAYGWASYCQENPLCEYVDTTASDEIKGGTPLIAACRAIVYDKLGDTVDVPADLVEPAK